MSDQREQSKNFIFYAEKQKSVSPLTVKRLMYSV